MSYSIPTLRFEKQSDRVDTVVATVAEGPQKGAYAATMTKLSKAGAFKGGANSAEFLRFGGAGDRSLLLLGLGKSKDANHEVVRRAGGRAMRHLSAKGAKVASVDVDSIAAACKGEKSAVAIRAFLEGMMMGGYQFEKYRSDKDQKKDAPYTQSIVLKTKSSSLQRTLGKELDGIVAVGEACRITRDWSNEPSNHGTPVNLANDAKRLARQVGIKCTILNERDMKREKMGLMLGVGQGSKREGRFVILEYTPKKKTKRMKTVGLVGKGITFDAGGISIKPSMRMEEMKHDMTGAATVMGAIYLAARRKIPNRVVAVLALTENMPGGEAIQPGNVLTSRSGKTVEIINTDAEGRLVLGDALDYIKKFKPHAIMDAATLTGAVEVALGRLCTAALGNDPKLVNKIIATGAQFGERVWELPCWDEYFDDMKSDHADMKNSVNNRAGGTIRGAMFLKQFVDPKTPWVHFDIASTAWDQGFLPYCPKKGASGLMVRTMAGVAETL